MILTCLTKVDSVPDAKAGTSLATQHKRALSERGNHLSAERLWNPLDNMRCLCVPHLIISPFELATRTSGSLKYISCVRITGYFHYRGKNGGGGDR